MPADTKPGAGIPTVRELPATLVIGGNAIDARTKAARRYREVCGALANDLGGEPTMAQWILIGRAASLTVQLEAVDIEVASGRSVDGDTYTRLTNILVRTIKELGTRRKTREPATKGPAIDDHAQAVLDATNAAD